MDTISEQLAAVDGKVEVSEHGIASQSKQTQDELFVWPWMGIVANLPMELKDGKFVGNGVSWLKHKLTDRGFNPVKVRPLWNSNGFSGVAVVEFDKGLAGFHSAMSFESFYAEEHLGKREWHTKQDRDGELYGWVAREADYYGGGVIGKYLSKNANLKSINDLVSEDNWRTNILVSDLTNVINHKDNHIHEMKSKVEEASSTFEKVMEERDTIIDKYNAEKSRMHLNTQNHLRGLYEEHESRKKHFESQKKDLEVCRKELEMRETRTEIERRRLIGEKRENSMKSISLQMEMMAQQEADADLLKLLESHKLEKENLYKQISELRVMENTQSLELEIEHLKGTLKVMSHMQSEEDQGLLNKMKELKEMLKEKEEDLQDAHAMRETLEAKKKKNLEELEEAHEELITGLKQMSHRANIRVKIVGDLDMNLFRAACKRKYNAEEAELKSAEVYSLWDSYIRNPEWDPYKTVKVHGKDQAIIDEEDEKLKSLRNELGDEVHNAVVKTLMEIKEYDLNERRPIEVAWNFKADRRATLTEGAVYLVDQFKKTKGKKKIY